MKQRLPSASAVFFAASAIFLVALFLIRPRMVLAESISSSHYSQPTTRYGHFALGPPHEYARLQVRTQSGQDYQFDLPPDEVFEDLAPRLFWRDAQNRASTAELLTIVSHRRTGARLVLFGLDQGQLVVRAQSTPIGQRNRWLNPIAVGDLDADGQNEIAAVITPHIGGILTIYQIVDTQLMPRAELRDVSNHVYGSPQLDLASEVIASGRRYLLIPNQTRKQLRLIQFTGNGLIEISRCDLPKKLINALVVTPSNQVFSDFGAGVVHLRSCHLPAP